MAIVHDERNFRSTYYEKVGCKSVEEKKSLEILLKDKVLDRSKLKQFCLRFSVPAGYRNLLWKVLLGILPVYVECHPFITTQRKQEYKDLLHALHLMRIVDQNTPRPQTLLMMWLLQNGNLTYENNLRKATGFTHIVQFFMQFYEDDSDVYWLSKNFYDNIKKVEIDFPKLVEITHILLEKEDPLLFQHLKDIEALDDLPLLNWFYSCFSCILNYTALARIWDKVCGGSYKIMVYVVIVILTNFKHVIMRAKKVNEVILCFEKISEENVEVIVNKAIDIWQQHGSYLTVHDKPKPMN